MKKFISKIKKSYHRFMTGKSGFSLVELIVVIAIMAVMAAVLAPSLLGYVEKSRMQKDSSAMDEVTNAMHLSLADQDVYDELLQASVKNNYSCYADGDKKTNINANKILTKDPQYWLFNDQARLLDETIYKPAGKMRGVTITFKSNGKAEYILKDGIVNQIGDSSTSKGSLAGKTIKDSNFEYTYNRLRSAIGDTIKVSSQTYRNSDYTIFISMGTTGGNEAIMQDAIQVYGQYNGTNLPEVPKADDIAGGNQDGAPNDDVVFVENGIVSEDTQYIDSTGNTYNPGEEVPEPVTGDTYITKYYKLMYNYSYYGNDKFSEDEALGGWSIMVKDTTLESYPDIPAYINGEPVVDLHNTFEGCANMKYSPKLPDTVLYMVDTYSECYGLLECPKLPANVTDMYATFQNCTSLKDASSVVIPSSVVRFQTAFGGCTALEKPPVLNEGITNMVNAFKDCIKLKNAPIIPSTVTEMTQTFYNCKELTSATPIPSKVKKAGNTFYGCVKLKGTITVHANPTNYTNMLKGSGITAVDGDTTLKVEILATK